MKTLKLENLKLHVIFWAIFIVYELAVSFSFGGKFTTFPDYAGHYLLNIGLFYFNAHVVFPTAINRKRKSYFILTLLIIAELVLYMLLKFLLTNLLVGFNFQISRLITNTWSFFVESIWRAVYFIGLSTGYWFALSTIQDRKIIDNLENINVRNELQNQILEKTLLSTENAYLKAQINPHFLLNTLNFLYNSVSKFSEETADSILLLSDIMRYALTNADEDGKVKLALEIEHINSFIKLNQARFSQRLNIDFRIDGNPDGLRIIPLVLITLAENVLKYGDLLAGEYPAKIIVLIEGYNLTFITQNRKRKTVHDHGYGIGIKNVKDRLAMHYKYELIIEDSKTEYKSILKIEL
ncbi:sensor histidine kinase [Mucilaginibacter sp. X5P1]|uniref:sensor histidine kinase n=1 Tax=Mucilaginibacter sp. X5P1 TaxID=2723088 RepID=UPI00160B73B0|nr:sensor histidine kinase [Mucilaginibacter sp. X5P1]MBB6136848.1 sensor histidine kinase YesM [Mucilaginibacter sp. X5P1]